MASCSAGRTEAPPFRLADEVSRAEVVAGLEEFCFRMLRARLCAARLLRRFTTMSSSIISTIFSFASRRLTRSSPFSDRYLAYSLHLVCCQRVRPLA